MKSIANSSSWDLLSPSSGEMYSPRESKVVHRAAIHSVRNQWAKNKGIFIQGHACTVSDRFFYEMIIYPPSK